MTGARKGVGSRGNRLIGRKADHRKCPRLGFAEKPPSRSSLDLASKVLGYEAQHGGGWSSSAAELQLRRQAVEIRRCSARLTLTDGIAEPRVRR